MISLDISLNEDQLRHVRDSLLHIPGAANRAIARAINRAVEGARTDTVKAICTEYTIKPTDVRKAILIKRAKPNKLEAQIISTGSPIPLFKFKVNPKSTRSKRRVVASVKFGSAVTLPPYMFIQKMGTGRVGVFSRKNNETNEISGRMPITQKYAPSFPQMLGNEEVLKYVEMKAYYRLDKELGHQVRYLFGGGR
ncbi:MAG: phage tail protein [Synergistaceae bacterium]|jgi:hypothetical protein|nr:phage tail protein [Synergistaceae bacterium]